MEVITVYIANRSSAIDRLISNLRKRLNSEGNNQYRIEVVDIFVQPDKAIAAGILATPTIVRKKDKKTYRAIGDFTDIEKVLAALGIRPNSESGLQK